MWERFFFQIHLLPEGDTHIWVIWNNRNFLVSIRQNVIGSCFWVNFWVVFQSEILV
eukprot:UN28316